MDKWKYYDIRHKRHLLCNPMNKEKFERLCKLLRLSPKARVLDIACGKGEFLIRLAELYNISGVGVDISPYCISDCLRKRQNRVPNSNIEFIEMDGAKYEPETPPQTPIFLLFLHVRVKSFYRASQTDRNLMLKGEFRKCAL